MIHERRRQENFAQTIHSTIEDEVDKKADISPAIGRTACPYEGVSGVNQLFFLSDSDSACSSLCFFANSRLMQTSHSSVHPS
jgi:hypothetical protein